MASEEQNEEEVEQAEGGKKSYWWLTLSLLLVFLAGGGYFALKAMRQSAQKLAGVESAGLSADSSVYSGDARGKAENVFASDEPGPAPAAKAAGSALNDKLKPGWVKEMVAEASSKEAASQAVSPQGAQDEETAQGGQPAAAPQGGGAMSAKLQAKASFGGRAGAAASKTAAPSGAVGDFQANGAAVGKPSVQKTTGAAAPRKGGGGGVLDALKGAFRASFYGARLASQDAAKGWIAKSFDASPEAETSIEYDPKMKAKLDVVNPNSIPKFLRDQDVSAAEAKTLATSAPGSPSMDKDGTKDSLDEDKDYQKKKAASDLAKSMLNPLFGALGGLGGDSSAPTDPTATDPASEDPAAKAMQDPNADPSLGSVDEYGNTTISGEDGMNYIFDPDGKLLGCDNGSMCIMPGGDGCAAGMYLS